MPGRMTGKQGSVGEPTPVSVFRLVFVSADVDGAVTGTCVARVVDCADDRSGGQRVGAGPGWVEGRIAEGHAAGVEARRSRGEVEVGRRRAHEERVEPAGVRVVVAHALP